MTLLKTSLALIGLLPVVLQARTIADKQFPDMLMQTHNHQRPYPELHLNGAAIRSYFYLTNTYVGLLYMENPTNQAAEVINDTGYKRIVYHVLVNRVSGRQIAKALYDALQMNVSEDEAQRLEDRLEQLVKMFDLKMERGDQGYVDYIPGIGSRVVVKNKVKGILPGKDLYDALLKIWVGEHPVSEHFKDEILSYQPNHRTDESLNKK